MFPTTNICTSSLERQDVEQAILQGRIEKTMTHDVRGIRYRIEGPAMDNRLIHVSLAKDKD